MFARHFALRQRMVTPTDNPVARRIGRPCSRIGCWEGGESHAFNLPFFWMISQLRPCIVLEIRGFALA